MSKELRGSVRCRNYAHALRMMTTGKQTEDDVAILCIADLYEQFANLLESIHRSRNVLSLS